MCDSVLFSYKMLIGILVSSFDENLHNFKELRDFIIFFIFSSFIKFD